VPVFVGLLWGQSLGQFSTASGIFRQLIDQNDQDYLDHIEFSVSEVFEVFSNLDPTKAIWDQMASALAF